MTGCAYRSRTQEPVEAYDAIREATRAWSRAASEWSRELGAEGRFVTTGRRVVGFPWDGDAPAPDGWRVRSMRDGGGMIVPNKRVKLGKAAAARLDAIGVPPTTEELPGMPNTIWVPTGRADWTMRSHYFTDIFVHDGALWGRWNVDRDLVEKEKDPNVGSPDFRAKYFDPDMWENVPLSVYYAASEAHEAAVEAVS